MRIVFYVSGHGFGHASRSIELIRALLTRRPDARVVVRTAAPRRLFTAMADAPAPTVDVQALEADTGIVQVDSLRLDEEETARQAARFHATFDRRVAGEADLLQRERADVVIGDIPPLAFAAAARAGVPSVAVGNFTWDWIYSIYPAFDRLAPDVIPAIRRAYATTTHALRLPLHGGFEPMADGDARHPVHRPPVGARSRRHPPGTGPRRRSADRPAVVRRLWRRAAARAPETLGPVHADRAGPGSAARLALPGSRRRRRRRCHQAGVRDRVGMHRQRHGAALHVARPLRRIRRVCRGNAARLAVPLLFRRKICSPDGGTDAIEARWSSSPRRRNGPAWTARDVAADAIIESGNSGNRVIW